MRASLLRTAFFPPNPCTPIGRRFVGGLAVCGVIYNPAFERLDARTLIVSFEQGDLTLRGALSAPSNPCNVELIHGFFPLDVAGVTAVTATLETDIGILVTGGPGWPGAGLGTPPNPCTLTLTPG